MSKIERAVAAKMHNRAEFGLNKYGVTMERTDLSRLDWLIHAQEEAMDLAVYLERLIQDCREISKMFRYGDSVEIISDHEEDGIKSGDIGFVTETQIVPYVDGGEDIFYTVHVGGNFVSVTADEINYACPKI